MTTFVKVCPKCGHQNPEYENACTVCTYFIGMETPVAADSLAPHSSPKEESTTSEVRETTSAPPVEASPSAITASASVFLQVLGTDQIHEVHDGWIIGQAHATSEANLQLRDLPNINYVHRNHCRFSLEGGIWYVTALDQKPFGRDFTNPTLVNQTKIPPGDKAPLNNGDQLSLATIKFVVRIV